MELWEQNHNLYSVYIAVSWNGTETQLEIMMHVEYFEVILHNYVCELEWNGVTIHKL